MYPLLKEFTSSSQDRQDSLREYASTVGAEFFEINDALSIISCLI
jgi:hypothetical protein